MTLQEMKIKELLAAIAAKTPTPGGGAVASITAGLAAALGGMVVSFSLGKKSLAQHAQRNESAAQLLEEFASRAIKLAEDDARAYGRLNELGKLEKNDARRKLEFPMALMQAIDIPNALLALSIDLLKLLHRLIQTTNPMLKSDLAIAAVLAEAAARSAAWNVRINLPLLDDASARSNLEDSLSQALQESTKLCTAIEDACGIVEH